MDSVWEDSENMGDMRQCNFSTPLIKSVQLIWIYFALDRSPTKSNFMFYVYAQGLHPLSLV